MHIILVKNKQSVKQRNRPISGPIRSDPVIRPDPVNTRTPIVVFRTDVYLKGLASYLFYQYYCLHVNRVYTEINTFLPPFSKRLFIAMNHRKVFNVETVNIQIYVEKILTEFTRISI